MKVTKITCDRCGKEITNDINGCPSYLNNINISLTYWHGGSMGGKEDVDTHSFEICDNCARELSYFLKKWRKNQIKNIEHVNGELIQMESENNQKEWKVCGFIPDEDCGYLSWDGLDENPLTIDVPFLPRIGETIWISEEQDKFLRNKVEECWKESHDKGWCEECPFCENNGNSISFEEFMYVRDIIYDSNDKNICLELSREPIKM